jgi:selenocysteine-specific elongation factor
MRVIGTAGHVDHGKSTLVEALTGYHPDRLKEEREREMTIDLGFAWLNLPDGEEVGIIDVPGHRDFIENMLAGVGGIDAALFVIAADEGIMPQTREHLAILDLLQIKSGVVALTKTDVVDDEDWLDLVEEDVRQAIAGTVLENAVICRVSARSGAGLTPLIEAIQSCLAEKPPRPDLGKPRLPIDRIFTMAGFGTVVTGTLIDGSLSLGDEIEVLPSGVRGRVRGLQTHKKKEDLSVPGSRTAVNITGISTEDVQRGDVVIPPGDYQPTIRMDVSARILNDASRPLRHNTQVKLYIGASEVLARVRLLGVEEINPGENGWIQLELTHPVVAVRNDRLILRQPSPGETIGGGEVVDPHPKGRHKRFSPAIIARLEALTQGSPADVLLQALQASGYATLKDVIASSHLDNSSADQAVVELVNSGQLIVLEAGSGSQEGNQMPVAAPGKGDLVASKPYLDMISERAVRDMGEYHKAHPLKAGMPREELKSRLKTPVRLFNAIMSRLIGKGLLKEAGPLISLPSHAIRFTPHQQRAIDQLLLRFAEAPYSPPSIKECHAEVGEEVYSVLVDSGRLIPVNGEVVFSREGYERMVQEVRQLLEQNGQVSAAQVRDHLNTSRKYVLGLLEYLDQVGITVREGDLRRLKK